MRNDPQPLIFKLSTLTPEAPVRARIFLAGLFLVAAACSRPDAEPVASDDRDENPDLALTAPTGATPVASDVEVGQAQPAAPPRERVPTPPRESEPEPMPEPLGSDVDGDLDASPATAVAPAPVETSHVHPRAADPVATAEEGGGKPRGVSTGLGPVPDRNWGDPGIMDDPNPLPGIGGPIGVGGRGGAVIIRGGAGGIDDDCAKHPRGGMVAGGGMPAGGPAVLVNDRDPRRGALINERAPRTSQRPSLPRGGGFPGRGIR